ncbi:hypothetical protein D3C77_433650 [compost metagenome]
MRAEPVLESDHQAPAAPYVGSHNVYYVKSGVVPRHLNYLYDVKYALVEWQSSASVNDHTNCLANPANGYVGALELVNPQQATTRLGQLRCPSLYGFHHAAPDHQGNHPGLQPLLQKGPPKLRGQPPSGSDPGLSSRHHRNWFITHGREYFDFASGLANTKENPFRDLLKSHPLPRSI